MVAALALFALQLGAQTVGQRCERQTIRHKGAEREYWLYVPKQISPEGVLLVHLHGYTGLAIRENRHLIDLAEEHGFVLCFPQGLKDGRDKTCWNVGYPFQEGLKTDDIGFIRKLVRHLQKQYGLREDNAFMSGMSNGGEMCYLMAQKQPGLFAGIMSMAGLTLRSMEPLKYRQPVPFMEVHGTSDKVSRWTGDPVNKYGWGAYHSVPTAVSYVVAGGKCGSYSREELPKTGRHQVILHKYMDGAPMWQDGPLCEVWLYEVQDGAHNWADDSLDTYAQMWQFMEHFMHRQ